MKLLILHDIVVQICGLNSNNMMPKVSIESTWEINY
jgi:hypothetical protein